MSRGSMKNTIKKLQTEQIKTAKELDFNDLMFEGKVRYNNSMESAENAEMYALKMAVAFMFEEIKDLKKTNNHLQIEINKLKSQQIKPARSFSSDLSVRLSTGEEINIQSKRDSKWNKTTIFRAFDLHRRETGNFNNLLPEEVRNNWSSIYVNSRKYTKSEQFPDGLTVKELLNLYGMERGLY